MKKTVEYIPVIGTFVALLMGLSSYPKWDSAQVGLHHLTPFGWWTCGLGLPAVVASLWITRSSLDRQERLRKISHAEARLALSEITYPFFRLFGDDEAETALHLVPQHIEDRDRLTSVMRIEVRSNSPFDHGFGCVPWDKLLKAQADRGASRLDRLMQIYAAYLEPKVFEALAELRTSEFLVLRLQSLDVHVYINRNLKFIEFPFVNAPDMSDRFGFGQFWKIMSSLNRLLDKDPERLRRSL